MERNMIWEGDTASGHYEIVDCLYDGRPARLLYSGKRQAAQSGLATDDESDLLFDYIQRMYELAMNLVPNKVLIIGGGVGTLATALIWGLPDVSIDIVEPDNDLIQLAYKYFNLPDNDRLRIFYNDGRHFLREQSARYDMIFVDAFMHTTIPPDLKTIEAFQAYHEHLAATGTFAMNIISGYYGPSGRTLREIYAVGIEVFETVDIFVASKGYSLWLPQNFVLTGQKGRQDPLKDYVRYDAIKPPEVLPNMVLHD